MARTHAGPAETGTLKLPCSCGSQSRTSCYCRVDGLFPDVDQASKNPRRTGPSRANPIRLDRATRPRLQAASVAFNNPSLVSSGHTRRADFAASSLENKSIAGQSWCRELAISRRFGKLKRPSTHILNERGRRFNRSIRSHFVVIDLPDCRVRHGTSRIRNVVVLQQVLSTPDAKRTFNRTDRTAA